MATGNVCIVERNPSLPAGTGALFGLPAALDFYDLYKQSKLTAFWTAAECFGSGGWQAEVSGINAALAPAVETAAAQVLATHSPTGGPNGIPTIVGLSSDPAGVMITPAGIDVVDVASDFTLAFVARPGSGAQSSVCGIVGNDGKCINVLFRSSNICTVQTIDASKVATTVVTTSSMTSTDFAAVEIQYNKAAGTLKIVRNGVTLATATGVNLSQNTKRLSLLGGFDLTDDVDKEGRGVSLAFLAVMPVDLGADTDARTKWRAMVTAQCPSITF